MAFTESEIVSAGIHLSVTPGETTCHSANRLHVDASASRVDSIRQLCHDLFNAHRQAFRVTKSAAADIATYMKATAARASSRGRSVNVSTPQHP